MNPPEIATIPKREEVVEDDWEEWDGKGPFWIHCVAGSTAGVAEHTLVYPLDTVRTHIQVCASCIHRNGGSVFSTGIYSNNTKSMREADHTRLLRGLILGPRPSFANTVPVQPRLPTGIWQTLQFLINQPVAAEALTAANPTALTLANPATAVADQGWVAASRLFRGVETVLVGCVPAHALYFSIYETLKSAASRNSNNGEPAWWASSLTGAAATMGHDFVMTPLDTVKQRLQLGHYKSTYYAFREIIHKESAVALYRSFPITLLTNIPYGMVFMPINEQAKIYYERRNRRKGNGSTRTSYQNVLLASATAGFVASAVTTPLDRIKTALQTQTLAPACLVNPREVCKQPMRQTTEMGVILHNNWLQAAHFIWQTEGFRGFWRGVAPRVLSHTPAVAISWTSYELAKQALMRHFDENHSH